MRPSTLHHGVAHHEVLSVTDPVNQPDAYRRMLLGALGDRDPLVVLGGSSAAARQIVEAAGPSLRQRPAAGEWSALECIAHMTDSDLIAGARMRWIASEDEPDIVGYDQALWVSELRQNEDDPQLLLSTFAALRRWNLDFWARLPETSRGRVGIHRERGPESIELIFRLSAGHDIIHLDQARRALEAAREVPETSNT
jgi:hypothetical protein